MIGCRRGSSIPVALAFLLAACGASPVESISGFPPGVTGQLAYIAGTDLRVVDASGNDRVIYSTVGSTVGAILELAWAPDGRHLAFRAPLPGIGYYQPALYQIGIGDRQPIALFRRSHVAPEESARYSRSGRLAYKAATSGGPGVPPPYYGIFIDSVFAFPGLGRNLDWTPDEQALVLSDSTDLFRLRIADGSLSRIWSSPGDTVAQPAVSPDGTRIAFVRHAGVYATSPEVWTVGIDGTVPIQLSTGHFDLYPAWTADGHYVAFSRFGSPGAEGVCLVPVTGGTATRLVALADNTGGTIAWSR